MSLCDTPQSMKMGASAEERLLLKTQHLAPIFRAGCIPRLRDNSRLTSAGATSKDGLVLAPLSALCPPGRPSLRPLAPTMSVAKTRTKFPTGGPRENDNSLSAASGVRIGHELLRHSPARKEGAAR